MLALPTFALEDWCRQWEIDADILTPLDEVNLNIEEVLNVIPCQTHNNDMDFGSIWVLREKISRHVPYSVMNYTALRDTVEGYGKVPISLKSLARDSIIKLIDGETICDDIDDVDYLWTDIIRSPKVDFSPWKFKHWDWFNFELRPLFYNVQRMGEYPKGAIIEQMLKLIKIFNADDLGIMNNLLLRCKMDFNFSQRVLLALEYSNWWFPFVQNLYGSRYHRNNPNHRSVCPLMRYTISLSYEWFQKLQTVPFKDYLQWSFEMITASIGHRDEDADFDFLIQCGDVESNPGPVMSKFSNSVCNNPPSTLSNVHAQVGGSWWNLPQYLSSIMEFLTVKLPSLLENSKELFLNGITTLKEDVGILKNCSQNFVNSLSSIKSDLIKVICIFFISCVLCYYKCYKTVLIINILSLVKEIWQLPRELRSVLQWYQKQDVVEAQVEGFEGFSCLAPILLTLTSFYCINKIPNNSEVEQYSKKMFNMSKGMIGAKNMYGLFVEMWQHVSKFLNEQLGLRDVNHLASFEEDVQEWIMDVQRFSSLDNRNQARCNPDLSAKMENLLLRGMKFTQFCSINSVDKKVREAIGKYMYHAHKIYQWVDENNAIGGGTRFKPLGICLFGDSQIGKTAMIDMLIQDILLEMDFTDYANWKNEIYARQPETEFWDGYKGQTFLVYDDAFAIRDSIGKPNVEIAETIRVINDFAMHLHMANLSDKNTYNTSKVVIWTVNEMNVDAQSMSFPDAFFNRVMKNCYKVEPATAVLNTEQRAGNKVVQTLNKEKLEELKNGEPLTTEIYKITKYERKFVNGKPTFIPEGESMTYSEFSEHVRELYRNMKSDYNEKKNFLNERMKQLIQKKVVAQSGDYFDASDEFDVNQMVREGCQASIDAATSWNDDILKRFTVYKLVLSIMGILVTGYQCYKLFNQMSKDDKEEVSVAEIVEAEVKDMEGWDNVFDDLLNKIRKNDTIPNEAVAEMLMLHFSRLESFRWKQDFASANDTIKQVLDTYSVDEDRNSKFEYESKYYNPLQNQRQRKVQAEAFVPSGGDMQQQRQRKAVAEGCSDQGALECGSSIVRRNMYYASVQHDGREIGLGSGLIITGKILLIPYHFVSFCILKKFLPNDRIILRKFDSLKNNTKLCEFPLSHIIDDGELINGIRLKDAGVELDACLINLDSYSTPLHLHSNCIPQFITREQVGWIAKDTPAFLLGYGEDGKLLTRSEKFVSNLNTMTKPVTIELEGTSYQHVNGFSYTGITKKGDCGHILLVLSKRVTTKVLGIHIAGSHQNVGFALKLTQEILNDGVLMLQEKLGSVENMEFVVPAHIKEDCGKTPEGAFELLGKAEYKLNSSSRSQLIPSMIHNEITPVISKPAYLRPIIRDGKVIDPAMLGLKKSGGEQTYVSKKLLDIASNDVLNKVCTTHLNLNASEFARELTYEEAIQGTDDEYMRGVARTTSPGYPWNSDPKLQSHQPGKTAWMGKNEEWDFTSKKALELRDSVNSLLNDCRNGIIGNVICADTMKDERRPIDKVEAGKTRMFAACPMHFVVAFRKHFLGFSSWCMHNRIENELGVGINPFGLDWDILAKKLVRKGHKVFAGDFKNFDGSLLAQILWYVFDIIDKWYQKFCPNNENSKIRRALWHHLVNAVHIYGDDVYMVFHSQPSGNPFTTIINSIYNVLLFRVVYLLIVLSLAKEDRKYLRYFNMAEFNRNISIIAYGDDNCVNISDEIADWFNQVTVAEMMLTLGHEYTDEEKTGVLVKYRTINDINFLKRKFVYNKDILRITAPIEESVVWEILNWERKNNMSHLESMRINIDTCSREMVLHGREKYEQFKRKLLSNKKILYKVQPQFKTYEELIMEDNMNICYFV